MCVKQVSIIVCMIQNLVPPFPFDCVLKELGLCVSHRTALSLLTTTVPIYRTHRRYSHPKLRLNPQSAKITSLLIHHSKTTAHPLQTIRPITTQHSCPQSTHNTQRRPSTFFSSTPHFFVYVLTTVCVAVTVTASLNPPVT
jgi:hypothetical protein